MIKKKIARLMQYAWYNKNTLAVFISLLLLPLTLVYWLIMNIRKLLYTTRIFTTAKTDIPVWVVGNISVGGTGKTPCVLKLASIMQEKKIKFAIVTRGYGGTIKKATLINSSFSAQQVGDEALLLLQRSDAPVVVARNRSEGVNFLAEKGFQLAIADDGMQHLRMQPSILFALIDKSKMFGNGFLLPSGPLREPVAALRRADIVICHENKDKNSRDNKINDTYNAYKMQLEPRELLSIDSIKKMPVSFLSGKKIHAVAAIGSPERFFLMLEKLGAHIVKHAFPDHYIFKSNDVVFNDECLVVMTEKDAVKMQEFNLCAKKYWFIPVDAVFNENLHQFIEQKLMSIKEKK